MGLTRRTGSGFFRLPHARRLQAQIEKAIEEDRQQANDAVTQPDIEQPDAEQQGTESRTTGGSTAPRGGWSAAGEADTKRFAELVLEQQAASEAAKSGVVNREGASGGFVSEQPSPGRIGVDSDAARMSEIARQDTAEDVRPPKSDSSSESSERTIGSPVAYSDSDSKRDTFIEDSFETLPGQLVGFRGPIAAQAVGITYRQLDYWTKTGLVAPSIRSAAGSDGQRLYSFKDLLVLKIVKRLLDAAVPLHNIRVVVEYLRDRSTQDLIGVTLFSDGQTVYEATSDEEVADLLRGGEGVLGIAVQGAIRELRAGLIGYPIEQGEDRPHAGPASDWILHSVG